LQFWGWEGYLFAIFNIATALVTYFFFRRFPRELSLNRKIRREFCGDPQTLSKSRYFAVIMERVVMLILLSFALCLIISIAGGLISFFIQSLAPIYTEEKGLSPNLYYTMFHQSFPALLREILVRIPMNIVDRLISAFAGYGIAMAVSAFLRRINSEPLSAY
jgi:hypothetical protein